jgi:hypothetical protein
MMYDHDPHYKIELNRCFIIFDYLENFDVLHP